MTEPLTPLDLDLRSMSFMPLDVVRLRDSDLASQESAEGFRAAVLLWCVAWHQVPSASLPKDDASLARYSGFGRDVKSWNKIRDIALHGFIECSDGRLYHPVIALKANEANAKRIAYRQRTANATESRRKAEIERNDQRNDRDDTERSVHQGKVSKLREVERKQDAADAAIDPKSDLYRRGEEVLGAKSGGLINKLLKAKQTVPAARAALELASMTHDAREYIGACVQGADARENGDAW